MSYAIIKTGGKQFRAEPGKTLRVPTMLVTPVRKSSSTRFSSDSIGKATSKARRADAQGAKVTGEIVKHGLGEKIVVFKFRRRKNYAKKQGHRQGFTEIRINDIKLG